MFSVELVHVDDDTEPPAWVDMYLDRNELKLLAEDLLKLADRKDYSKIGLFSESWGRGDLSEVVRGENSSLVHLLRIFVVPDEE